MHDIVHRFVDVLNRNTENPIATRLEVGGLALVRFAAMMLSSVNLDDETSRKTGEVGEVGTDRELPAEFVAGHLSVS